MRGTSRLAEELLDFQEGISKRWYLVVYVSASMDTYVGLHTYVITYIQYIHTYVGHLESKERLRIQPAQLFNFS